MKIKSPLVWKTAGLLGSALIRNWMGTIDFKVAYYDAPYDPVFKEPNRNFVVMFWHEHILAPLYFRRYSDITMMLSLHDDARIVWEVGKLFGYEFIRGSSFKGGAAAVRNILSQEKAANYALVPDGPRGPYRTMSPGAIFLASKLECPILLLAYGYDKYWRANSWDRFVIPKPFCRGRMILSGPISIPSKLTQGDREHYRIKLETLLTELTDEAENWAKSGAPMVGETHLLPGPKNSILYYANGGR